MSTESGVILDSTSQVPIVEPATNTNIIASSETPQSIIDGGDHASDPAGPTQPSQAHPNNDDGDDDNSQQVQVTQLCTHTTIEESDNDSYFEDLGPTSCIDNDLVDSDTDSAYDSISDSSRLQTPTHTAGSPSHSIDHATADLSRNSTTPDASPNDDQYVRRHRFTIHIGTGGGNDTPNTAATSGQPGSTTANPANTSMGDAATISTNGSGNDTNPSGGTSQTQSDLIATSQGNTTTTTTANRRESVKVATAEAIVVKNQIRSKQDLESRQILVTKQPTDQWGHFKVDKFGRILNQESAANTKLLRSGNGSGTDQLDEVSRTTTQGNGEYEHTMISTSRQSSINSSDLRKLKEDGKKHKRDVERESKWVEMLSHWDEYCSSKREHILKRRIRKGIPSSARASVWPLLMRINETKSKYPPNYYQTLVHGTILEQHDIQIRKDLPRLMQDHIMFKSPIAGSRTVLCHGQAMLYNVLKAYSIYDPDVGYVQGMDTVAAPALMYFTEEMTFWYLERLLNAKKYGLRYSYIDGFPLAHQYVWVHEKLVQRYLPKLHRVMTENGIQHSGYAFRWYTMRYGQFAPELSFRILDIYLYEGDKILYRVALALLKQRMQILLNDPESILENLMKIENEYESHSMEQGDTVIELALKIKLTTEEINKLEDEYEQLMNVDMKRHRSHA